MTRLTRRRVLAVLAAIGGGSVLGGHAVSVARGTDSPPISLEWQSHPDVRRGPHGPILEFDSLERGQRRHLVVHVTDDRAALLQVAATLSPSAVPPESTLLWMGERATDIDCASGRSAVDESDGIRFGRPVDERQFTLELEADSSTSQRHEQSRPRCLSLAWGRPVSNDLGPLPPDTRLELRFASDSDDRSAGSDRATSEAELTNRIRTTRPEPSDIARFHI